MTCRIFQSLTPLLFLTNINHKIVSFIYYSISGLPCFLGILMYTNVRAERKKTMAHFTHKLYYSVITTSMCLRIMSLLMIRNFYIKFSLLYTYKSQFNLYRLHNCTYLNKIVCKTDYEFGQQFQYLSQCTSLLYILVLNN